MQTYFIELSYLLASVLFILGLKGLSHPETAKRGMHLAEFGMLMAIIGTLPHHEIVTYTWILSGLAIGSLIGLAMGLWVPMTAMPQRTALSCVRRVCRRPRGRVGVLSARGNVDKVTMGALGFEVMLGALTTTKFARLRQTSRPGARHTNDLQGPECFNMALLLTTIGIFLYLVVFPGSLPFVLFDGWFGACIWSPCSSCPSDRQTCRS